MVILEVTTILQKIKRICLVKELLLQKDSGHRNFLYFYLSGWRACDQWSNTLKTRESCMEFRSRVSYKRVTSVLELASLTITLSSFYIISHILFVREQVIKFDHSFHASCKECCVTWVGWKSREILAKCYMAQTGKFRWSDKLHYWACCYCVSSPTRIKFFFTKKYVDFVCRCFTTFTSLYYTHDTKVNREKWCGVVYVVDQHALSLLARMHICKSTLY